MRPVIHTAIRRRAFVIAAAAAGSAWPGSAAFAQEWKPSRPVKVLVGFGPGGSADLLARALLPAMSQKLGVPVVVDNVPGAAGNIAMTQLARSAPDGTTLGLGYVGSHAISPALQGDKLPFRVPDDFTGITQLATQPNVLIVNSSVPAKNLAEFVAWIKSKPGQVYGSAGVGTSNHLAAEMVSQRFGVKLTHVPYKSAAQVHADLIGGHIPMAVDQVTTAATLVGDGRVRAIAIMSAKRSPKMPDLPTFAELGHQGFELPSWQGLFGPKGLPPEVVAKLYEAVTFALADPAVKQTLSDFGAEAGGQRPERSWSRSSAITWSGSRSSWRGRRGSGGKSFGGRT